MGNFFFTTKGVEARYHQIPSHKEGTERYIIKDGKYIAVSILSIPENDDNGEYVVQEKESGEIHSYPTEKIHDNNLTVPPTSVPTSDPFPTHLWIKPGGKVTLYLHDRMKKPQQGKLMYTNGEWVFAPGRKALNKTLPLPNFEKYAISLARQ
eukprot:10920068-Ditylum_brightwellii.AAC.1